MNEISNFGIVLLFLITGFMFTLLALFVSSLLRPQRPNPQKLTTYECGEESVGNTWGQFNVRFYVIALIFVLFEVEIVFLFPWAVVFGQRDLIEASHGAWGWFAFFEMFLFVLILGLGLAYVWVKGYLSWFKPTVKPQNFESKVPQNLYEKVNKKYAEKQS